MGLNIIAKIKFKFTRYISEEDLKSLLISNKDNLYEGFYKNIKKYSFRSNGWTYIKTSKDPNGYIEQLECDLRHLNPKFSFGFELGDIVKYKKDIGVIVSLPYITDKEKLSNCIDMYGIGAFYDGSDRFALFLFSNNTYSWNEAFFDYKKLKKIDTNNELINIVSSPFKESVEKGIKLDKYLWDNQEKFNIVDKDVIDHIKEYTT